MNFDELYNITQKTLVTESGFSRVANVLRGNAPRIKTLAILTGENPRGENASPEFNKEANTRLKADLRSRNMGYIPVRGKYGQVENSFIVHNIAYSEALMLGQKYNQESIIFADRIIQDNYTGMDFRIVATIAKKINGKEIKVGDVLGTHKILVNISDAEDYYSEVKGRKFQIPFYEPHLRGADWESAETGRVKTKELSPEAVEQINSLTDTILEENRTPKSRWMWRGYIQDILIGHDNSV